MKKFLMALISLMTMCASFMSCEQEKAYIYQQDDIVQNPFEKDKTEVFYAKSDSDAYIEAFTRFYVAYSTSQTANNAIQDASLSGGVNIPITFRLYDSNANDITSTYFSTRKQKEEEIMKRVDEINKDLFKKLTANKK